MKKVLLWIAKIFKVDLTIDKVITKVDTIYVSLDNEVKHDVTINGNLTINGKLTVSGEITCYNKNNN